MEVTGLATTVVKMRVSGSALGFAFFPGFATPLVATAKAVRIMNSFFIVLSFLFYSSLFQPLWLHPPAFHQLIFLK